MVAAWAPAWMRLLNPPLTVPSLRLSPTRLPRPPPIAEAELFSPTELCQPPPMDDPEPFRLPVGLMRLKAPPPMKACALLVWMALQSPPTIEELSAPVLISLPEPLPMNALL